MVGSKPGQRQADWSAKLTRSLTLKKGNALVTLADARRVVLAHMATDVEDFALIHALRLLLVAADTGSLADRKAATEQVAIVLRARAVY